jgi:hypothetical protein
LGLAIRSAPVNASFSQTVLIANSRDGTAEGGLFDGPDPVLDSGVDAVPGFQEGELPRGADRDRPRRQGQIGDRVMDCLRHGETDREAQVQAAGVAQAAEMSQLCLGGAGAVNADQDRLAVPVRLGDLGDRLVDDLDVVGRGVGAGVPGPEHPGQPFTGVVRERQQRVISGAKLERGRGLLLLPNDLSQHGVQIEHQTRLRTLGAHDARCYSASLGREQPRLSRTCARARFSPANPPRRSGEDPPTLGSEVAGPNRAGWSRSTARSAIA